MKPNFDNILDQVISSSLKERLDALKKINIFSKITQEKLLFDIAGLLEKKQLEPNTLLFSKGDPSNAMYFIEKGSLLVHDGEYIFSVLITGEVVGEYSLIDDEFRSASITSITDVTLWELSKDKLDKHTELKFEITKALVKVLSTRLRLYNQLEAKLADSHDQIRKKNEEINIQKEELEAQAEHLEQVNKELEKLSIVARETNNAIAIMDAFGNYQWVNEGFTNMYGFDLFQLKKIKGNNIFDTPESFLLKQALAGKNSITEAISYEAHNETLWGEKIWVNTTLTPVYNSEGQITHIVSIDSNINELKLAETEILLQKEEILAQNEKLYEVNHELQKKNEQIIDSINYAHRIQNAVLPIGKNYPDFFTDNFVVFRPKNIVSGDFYWTKLIEDKKPGFSKIAIALADCTGHGVPGAFLSMLGTTLMNEQASVFSSENTSGDFLLKLRRQVIQALQQNDKKPEQKQPQIKLRDGMDVALCIVSYNVNETSTVQYSGANIPLYIVRKSNSKLHVNGEFIDSDMELNNYYLFEIKPDKQSICLFYKEEKLFTTHNINLSKGDRIYMSSDGYYDQLSPDKLKFQKCAFKNELLGMQELDMQLQAEHLTTALLAWQGCVDQTDDVSVMGFQI